MNSGFAYFAGKDASAVAIVSAHGRALSRGELRSRSNQLAQGLSAAGLQPGDTVAILAPNTPEYLIAALAAIQCGLYVVSINPHLSSSEMAYILQDSRAKVLFADARSSGPVAAALSEVECAPPVLISFGPIAGFSDLHEFYSAYPDTDIPESVRGRLLSYTSATTGRPKGVEFALCDTQAARERMIAAQHATGVNVEDGNVHLCASMLYHAAPLELAILALHMGHRVILADRWDPEMLLRLICEHSVTTTFMVPTMFVRMLRLPEEIRNRYSVRSLRFVVHGAAPCPVETKRRMIEWFGKIIWETYGACEGSGTIVSSEEWLRRQGTVGRPFPGSRVKILDDAGEEVPVGKVGNVYMTHHTGDRFRYRGDNEKTRAAYRGDFFTVGDVGYLDAEGYLFLCDRKIDMILRGGANIYPAELEDVLMQHPLVEDCAVFGVPDPLMGESIHVVIQPRSMVDAGPDLTASLFDLLATRLGPAKVPRRVEYLSALPRDPNGKIYKRRLRDDHWKRLGRNI